MELNEPMSEALGIFVSTDRHLDHIIGLAKAAHNRGKQVIIFFTHRGVLLTQDPKFGQLAAVAEMSLCRKSFEAFGLDTSCPLAGLPPDSFSNQSRHADLIARATRYVAL